MVKLWTGIRAAPAETGQTWDTLMADIVNLRQARKAKARDEAEARASANRAKHGRPKAERNAAAAEERLAERRLEGHRLDGDETR